VEMTLSRFSGDFTRGSLPGTAHAYGIKNFFRVGGVIGKDSLQSLTPYFRDAEEGNIFFFLTQMVDRRVARDDKISMF